MDSSQLTALRDIYQSLLRQTHPILLVGLTLMAAAGWWCQWLRYPAFRTWPEVQFLRKHTLHTVQISLVVIPGMLLQLLGTGLYSTNATHPTWIRISHVLLCLGSVGPTLLISGPIHGRLSRGKDLQEIERLIQTNLPRTLVWTAQLALTLIA